jgi:recombinational DNA repair protein (RecF pathway)
VGIWCVCVICKSTVDFNRIKDASEHMICEKCMDKVPNHVPESQSYHWLKRNKISR